eukprot:2921782-Rhodomonas_salina.1
MAERTHRKTCVETWRCTSALLLICSRSRELGLIIPLSAVDMRDLFALVFAYELVSGVAMTQGGRFADRTCAPHARHQNQMSWSEYGAHNKGCYP